MTRERIAGFLFGLSVGTAIGFLLKPPEDNEREIGATSKDHGAGETLENRARRMGPVHAAPELRKRA